MTWTMHCKKRNCNNLKNEMGIEVLINYFYRRSISFGPKTGILLYVSSERVVAKNFTAIDKMHKYVRNPVQKTDLKNNEK